MEDSKDSDIDLLLLDTARTIIQTDFDLLSLDTIDSINKMNNLEKKSFEYKFLHVHTLGNMNKMCEVLQHN
jgi:hypothetical protein